MTAVQRPPRGPKQATSTYPLKLVTTAADVRALKGGDSMLQAPFRKAGPVRTEGADSNGETGSIAEAALRSGRPVKSVEVPFADQLTEGPQIRGSAFRHCLFFVIRDIRGRLRNAAWATRDSSPKFRRLH